MIVSVLLLIIGGGLLTTFLTGQASYLSADAYIQVQQEARRAFDVITRELREAQMGPATQVGPQLAQLNFQIARGYNSEPSCQSPNPVGICWGSENATGEWLHYAFIGTGTPGSPRQLIRYRTGANTEAAGPPTPCAGATCRVLSNYVDTAANAVYFTWDSANKVVTFVLRNVYTNPALPAGRQATPLLTSKVRLRN